MSVKHAEQPRIFSVNMSEPNLRVIASARAVKDTHTYTYTLPGSNAAGLSCSLCVEFIEYLDMMKFKCISLCFCSLAASGLEKRAISGQ